MGLYQRHRPSSIQIFPNPVRRQAQETDSPDSPDSPQESGGEDSPDSPSSTGAPSPTGSQSPATTAPATTVPGPATTAAAVAPTSVPALPASSPSPSLVSSAPGTSAAAQTSSSTLLSSSVAQTSSSPPATNAASSSPSSSARAAVPAITAAPPAPNVAAGDEPEEPQSPASPATPTSSGISESPLPVSSSGSSPQPTSAVGSSSPTSTEPMPDRTGPARSQLSGASSGIEKDPNHTPSGHHVLGKGAQAALITSAILGFVALVIGGWFLYKRRRRRMESQGVLTTENGFAPGPGGTHSTRETVQIGYDPSSNAHMTRSTTNSNSLFGGSYQRPETVSTSTNSRAAPDQPLPTPNPFADPPRNKAFDVLRGRPRSTTLTDRGSWIKNPFRDPASDRFDPFGELQEKARQERVRYMQEIRQEEMERLEREREQQFLEKERMGLSVPEQARKGSGVTVDGVGVLDRSGSDGYR